MRQPIEPKLRLVKPTSSQEVEQTPLLRPIAETMTNGEVGRHIGSIVTRYKEFEEQRKEAAFEALKKKKTTERPMNNRDTLAADDAERRAAMATAVLRGFDMLDTTVEVDFASVYRKSDQRAVQSTGSDEYARELRRSMIGTMEHYFDHPALRAARSIMEVSITGGTDRKSNQTMILQRAIADVFEQEGVPHTPESS